MKYLECNHFKLANSLTQTDRRSFDVISYESNSYFTEAHEILVPVGLGDTLLPAPPRASSRARARAGCARACVARSTLLKCSGITASRLCV